MYSRGRGDVRGSGEGVADPAPGLDVLPLRVVRAQREPQLGDGVGDRGRRDVEVAPDMASQDVVGNQPSAPVDQREQHPPDVVAQHQRLAAGRHQQRVLAIDFVRADALARRSRGGRRRIDGRRSWVLHGMRHPGRIGTQLGASTIVAVARTLHFSIHGGFSHGRAEASTSGSGAGGARRRTPRKPTTRTT